MKSTLTAARECGRRYVKLRLKMAGNTGYAGVTIMEQKARLPKSYLQNYNARNFGERVAMNLADSGFGGGI